MTYRPLTGAEADRLAEDAARGKNWKRWGPYLSERQWGTVREDYSADGSSWSHFPHEQARSRAYRWGEDGLLGITDRQCRLCFGVALWNGADPILKERLFGLAGPEGNHGEDVKELYYYLDSTPTHSYLKGLYKYPQGRFPYELLVKENRARGRDVPEFELTDTGVFDEGRYFDVVAEYAKSGPNDVLIRLTVFNRGPDDAPLALLPTFWYRNSWIWGCRHEGCGVMPTIGRGAGGLLVAQHESLGQFSLAAEAASDGTDYEWLFTDNETNSERLFGTPSTQKRFKDAFHDYVVDGQTDTVNPRQFGTKVAALYRLDVPAGGAVSVRLRFASDSEAPGEAPDAYFGDEFVEIFDRRIEEAEAFYAQVIPESLGEEERNVARQSYAGLLWTKQFYHYVVDDWLEGDDNQPTPPASRKRGRNADWRHLYNRDVISMPDKWEYPWYAAWDTAFHMLPFSRVDPQFARDQLALFLREWYMHPNGQLPAYEFDFSDVNPPVHAWACWRVYERSGPPGSRDREFLASAFSKLLLNFTWWVNRKDHDGNHLFSGGFLGLDNIGLFDRSRPLPVGGWLDQADGTAWMGFYCTTMLRIALELAREDRWAEDIASKFLEHFIHIADAINTLGGKGLWDEEDGFYYSQIRGEGWSFPVRVRSIVGLVPLLACEILDPKELEALAGFRRRLEWFRRYRSDLARHIAYLETPKGAGDGPLLLALPSREKLVRAVEYLVDETEFLSTYGVRSLSRRYADEPYRATIRGYDVGIEYVPGESTSGMFGGNSNWRGPIWFPMNHLIIEALERYHAFYGDTLTVECPAGSGRQMNLAEVAREIAARLARIFVADETGRRACHGDAEQYTCDPHFGPLVLFHEYFHGDTGRGLGATHQTGWTALVTECLERREGRPVIKP